MARLPVPGSDDGKWGQILNEYLGQAHDASGNLKPNTVGSSQLQDGSVTSTALADASVTSAKLASGAVTKSDVGLGSVDNTSDADKPVSSATQTALDTKLAIAALDSETAAKISDGGSATGAALSASKVAHVNGFRDFSDKVLNQQNAVNLLVVGDSTSDLTTGPEKWTTGLAADLAALYPTHTVYLHTFDYTTTNDWNAATLVATGSGYRSDLGAAPELHVWVAGYAGHNWADWLIDSRRKKVFAATKHDAIIFALGHNDGVDAGAFAEEPFRSRDLGYIEWARTLAPQAQVVLCSQNPRPGPVGSPTYGHAEIRNDFYRNIARERGYGYINVTQAFYADGRSLVPGAVGGLIDNAAEGVHPTTDGYRLWRSVVVAQFKESSGAVPLPSSPPAGNLLTTPLASMQSVPILSNGWAASNATEAVETSIKPPGESSSVKLTRTAGGQASYVQYTLDANQLAAADGQYVTATGMVYIPSGVNAVGAWLFDTGSGYVLQPATLPETVMTDQWSPLTISAKVPTGAIGVRFRQWVVNNTAGDTPSIYVSKKFGLILGRTPFGLAAPNTVPTWTPYTPTLTGITLGNGTLTAAYRDNGTTTEFYARIVLGSTSAVTGPVTVSLPKAVATVAGKPSLRVELADTGSGYAQGAGFLFATDKVTVRSVGSPYTADLSSTSPWTWASTDYIDVSGVFRNA